MSCAGHLVTFSFPVRLPEATTSSGNESETAMSEGNLSNVRANLFPSNGLSPWFSFGAGFGHFSEKSELEFGGVNPGKTGTSTGVFQMGVGIDLRIFNYLA